MEGGAMAHETDLNLRLGLPGTNDQGEDFLSAPKNNNNNNNNKRSLLETVDDDNESKSSLPSAKSNGQQNEPAPKAQIVGWPPVRSYRKNNIQAAAKKTESETGNYVKVSMDGAPYLRKIDLKVYNGYSELLKALETMFKLTIGQYSEREGYKGSEHAPAYEDKDGDLMLVGDVPWNMFMSTCKRLRIMKGADAKGLGCGV